MYETRTSEDMDPLALGSTILTRLIVLYVMGFNTPHDETHIIAAT